VNQLTSAGLRHEPRRGSTCARLIIG